MGQPETILFLGANPLDTARLALGQEVREIAQRLRASDERKRFRVEQTWSLRGLDLQECLLRHKPTIVHFSGHGSSAGQLLLEDEAGCVRPVAAKAFADLFRILKRRIRCVVLNACHSALQASIIAEHVDFSVGMAGAIDDRAAIAFGGAFYQAIGYGEDVQTAFELGCNQLRLMGLSEADVPILFTACPGHLLKGDQGTTGVASTRSAQGRAQRGARQPANR